MGGTLNSFGRRRIKLCYCRRATDLVSMEVAVRFLVPGCVENGKLRVLSLIGVLGLVGHPQYHQKV